MLPPKLRVLEYYGSHQLPLWETLGLLGVGKCGEWGESGVFTGLGQDEEEQHGKCYQSLTQNLFSTSSSLAEL